MFFSKLKRSGKSCPNGLLSLPQKADIISKKKEFQCPLQQRGQVIHSKGQFLKYAERLAAKTGSAGTTFTSFAQENGQCNYKIRYKNF